MDWGAVNARARGLATHLLDRESLLLAAEAASWDAATLTLVERGYPAQSGEARLTPQEFDRVTGQVLAQRLGMLARWLGPRSRTLAILSEEAEFRTLRRLLRGTAQGISPQARLRGALPTAGLSEGALDRLSRAETPAQLADLLLRLGHPAGRALQSAGAGLRGSVLWRLEGALARLYAERAARAARRAGRAVRRFASIQLDLLNAEALLLRLEWGPEVSPEEIFLPGGMVLDQARFTEAAALAPDGIGAMLTKWFAGSPLGEAFGETTPFRSFEARALGAILGWQGREGRRNPLGPGVVLEVITRMRAEAHDVRLISGALELGTPRAVVAAGLVTPA
jgi:vacuolar-type H+-ATPase subunit C/Vma6